MEKRVELNWLLDFYGPLLTERRQRLLRLYLEEDLSLQEIADQIGISRQGVYDAILKSQAQLENYETRLSLFKRYRQIQTEVDACKRELEYMRYAADAEPHLSRALSLLNKIERIE